MENKYSKTKLILGILFLISLIPYKKLPPCLQDVKNILESINPLKRLKDKITAMTCDEAQQILVKGDHIYAYHGIYSHHGIYDGEGMVWEYDGMGVEAEIRHCTLEDFAKGSKINRLNYQADFTPEQIVFRAASRDLEQEYNLWNNNCMHYAFWCRLLSEESVTVMSKTTDLLLSSGMSEC